MASINDLEEAIDLKAQLTKHDAVMRALTTLPGSRITCTAPDISWMPTAYVMAMDLFPLIAAQREEVAQRLRDLGFTVEEGS